jgi:hypothetical protein
MAIGGTPIPKREIIALILRNISIEQIRSVLKIQTETDLHRRLDDFSKNQLLEVIQSTEEGRLALEETKANYPLTSNPTLYMISVSSWPDRQALTERTGVLANQMHEAAVWFGSNRSVRSVYMIAAAREYQNQIVFQEVPLVYEKKIEYVISDPESEDYGDLDVIYSLEKALIWYCSQYKHALLLCGDFQAVKPIIYFGSSKLGIRWQLPFLSEEMLQRLAEGANPRTASFSRLEDDPADDLDIQTMTISDQGLGESRYYRRLTQDGTRHQTFGFYSSHPDLVYGGLGISRQYGRIWTPARLRKDSLLALSVNLIQKTEQELNREADINLGGFIGYYRNTPIILAGKKVNATQRFFIEELSKAIITSQRSPNHETPLESQLIWDLVGQCNNLDLIPALEIHCENCGSYLLRCPKCQSPYIPIKEEGQPLEFRCPNHPEERIQDDQIIACECGANLEITFSTDIRIFPGAELLKSLHEFLAILENQQYDGGFQIIGYLLRLIPRPRAIVNQYPLDSFRSWRTRAHLHQRNLTDERKAEYRRVLNRIKEKCSRNGQHPTRETCNACMNEEISSSRIRSGDEMCLPRIFGYAIDMEFDGIHHHHEIADLRYPDILDETGEVFNLWIHLKSRERPRALGLGRTVTCVKGLYTQYCYSAYLATIREETPNVIGISVPNIISSEVVENFEYLANQLGFPLIILDEDDWVKIIDASLEKAAIEQDV